MADKKGWWTFSTNVEPSESDLEHIAGLIKEGYTSGEIIKDEPSDGEDYEDEVDTVFLTVGGKKHKCTCGNNLFAKIKDKQFGTIYRCTNCKSEFEGVEK